MLRIIPNKDVDINYNYLSDAIDSNGKYIYKAEDYHFCDEEKDCNNKTNINGFCYKDPDSFSKKLYKDFSMLTGIEFIDGKDNNYKGESKYYHLLYNKNPFTTDYIGVSKFWAKLKGQYSEIKIGEMLMTFRKLGGHMIWPSKSKNIKIEGIKEGYYTINTARGTKDGVYDRFDITLKAIKCFYEETEFLYRERVFAAVQNEKEWFDEYGSKEEGFKNFIDAFLLNDFVDNSYNVLSLVYNKPIEKNEKVTSIFDDDNFNKYVENNIEKIENRTRKFVH